MSARERGAGAVCDNEYFISVFVIKISSLLVPVILSVREVRYLIML